MLHGLMWFPLLGAFIWLARAGYIEYQKLEAYKRWAVGFDRCKYDIYAVIGLKDRHITWGKPTNGEPIDLQIFSLDTVSDIELIIDGKPSEPNNLPATGKKIDLQFQFTDRTQPVNIPFTEISMAVEWAVFLSNDRKIVRT
jgi:hypothetical protein